MVNARGMYYCREHCFCAIGSVGCEEQENNALADSLFYMRSALLAFPFRAGNRPVEGLW